MPKYEYDVEARPFVVTRSKGDDSPLMDERQMAEWLNHQAENGWEFVSYAQTHWVSGLIQHWWIFRRERK